jgi:hypothetical protein
MKQAAIGVERLATTARWLQRVVRVSAEALNQDGQSAEFTF